MVKRSVARPDLNPLMPPPTDTRGPRRAPPSRGLELAGPTCQVPPHVDILIRLTATGLLALELFPAQYRSAPSPWCQPPAVPAVAAVIADTRRSLDHPMPRR